MNESLLQFIWQHSLYNATALHTLSGERITVIHPGYLNTDAGPDFSRAKIKIGDTLLVGNVEIHVYSADWYKHGHQHDAAYASLALHVVYEHNSEKLPEGIPLLELKNSIDATTIARYADLTAAGPGIPCAGQLHNVKDITREAWLSRLLAERWEQKLQEWQVMLTNSMDDWRNLLYWRLAANFGFRTNAAPFLMLARSLPLNVATRHRGDLMQLEALFFGQAGMLSEDFTDDYPRELQREYDYLKKKYQLKPLQAGQWKFLRMRPANFPTIRIAQYAALVHQSVHLFSQIIEASSVADIKPLLNVRASAYWDDHYTFDAQVQKPVPKKLGVTSVENIVINTIAPIQFLYASRHGQSQQQEKALSLLETVPAEHNSIISKWQETGWSPADAGQSQAMLQLYNNYCSKKRCLECAVGLALMRR